MPAGPGCSAGTVIFREAADLPEELIFHINYLGGDMPNYTLNFSRPAYGPILQYFSFSCDMLETLSDDIHSAFDAIAREAAEGAQAPRTRRRPLC